MEENGPIGAPRKAEVKAVLGSNDVHDYRVGFVEQGRLRRINVMKSNLNKITHNQEE